MPHPLLDQVAQQGWQLRAAGAASRGAVASQLVEEASRALERVYYAAKQTPLVQSPWLSSLGQSLVSLKLENEQVRALREEGTATGMTTASSGNHALAMLTALAPPREKEHFRDGLRIFLPETVDPAKAARLEGLGAKITRHGTDCVEAERAARKACEGGSGLVYVSPYNDPQVAGGQGSIGWELLSELPPAGGPLRVYIPVGGGGLASGIAAVLKAHSAEKNPVTDHPLQQGGSGDRGGEPQSAGGSPATDPPLQQEESGGRGGEQASIHVVGCQPANSDVMAQSVAAERVLDLESADTLSDGTAGGVEEGALTFQACRELVDEWVSVTEEEIARAMVAYERHHGARIEGSAGVAVAAYQRQAGALPPGRAVIVVCGGNVSEKKWAQAQQLAGGVG